jgi:AcrR family transcriptional regulator
MRKGRPKDPELQEKTKAALLYAAKTLLSEKPYSMITIRELADAAQTQSPMISYYFGSKFGLIEALLKQKAQERQGILSTIIDKCLNESENSIETLVDGVLDMLVKEVWLLRLVQDETINDSVDLKMVIATEFSSLGANAVGRLLVELRKRKIIKQEINFQFFMVFFVSLVITPLMNSFLLNAIAGFDESIYLSAEWKKFTSQRLKSALGIEE